MTKVVISLGGSVFYPKNFNQRYLRKLFSLLSLYDAQFYIVVGGGALSRARCQACSGSIKEKHLAGISAITDNCIRVADVFFDYFSTVKVVDYYEDVKGRSNFIIGARKPGRSSDWNAVKVAEQVGAKYVLNLSNTDYVYDKDPNKYKTAKPVFEMNWKEFMSIIGNKIVPSGHYPFDPVASRLAKKLGLSVYFMNGNKLKRVEKFLEGDFEGSVVWG